MTPAAAAGALPHRPARNPRSRDKNVTTKLLLSTIAAVFIQAGCAHAQATGGSTGAPAAQGAPTVEVPNRARTTTGFRYGGQVTQAGDGVTRWAGYPVIVSVTKDSQAEKLGLRVGDVILSVNGRDGRESKLFPGDEPGISYEVRIRRGEEIHEFTVVRVLRDSPR